MPFVHVITRNPIRQDTKAALAKNLSDAILKIEIGEVTEEARRLDWMWFQVFAEDDWAVGGEFGAKYAGGRTMCFARIIVPEAFMSPELWCQALTEVTRFIRDALGTSPEDDGTGIWVFLDEVPRGTWAANGKALPLSELIKAMNGRISLERSNEIQARFSGIDRMKDRFGIPR